MVTSKQTTSLLRSSQAYPTEYNSGSLYSVWTMTNHLSVYETFLSLENLKLAWERVRYFDRLDSRDWLGLKVFAANRDYNLELLRRTLQARTFEPTYPEIKYLPKKSQTLRPMAVMAITDRVVFQATANVAAERARAVLSTVADRQSYANVLTEVGSKRMFNAWKPQYRKFQKNFSLYMRKAISGL